MGDDLLEDLRRLVVDDPSARERLLAVNDRDPFIAEVIEVAGERGLALSADQVEEGLRAARRHRLERWV